MKSLIPPFVLLAGLAGTYVIIPASNQSVDAPWAFDPGRITQNLCGPLGAKRGQLFRPDFAAALSSAAYADDTPDTSVPLLAGLDSRDFPISSQNAEARAYFRQGFALLYAFNHWEAIRAFKMAQRLDPDCAICHWGEAVAYGPNINAPMDAVGQKYALAALDQAVALKGKANARERALIEALETRYNEAGERRALDKAYADAMAAVVAQYPDDQDIATLYAEALMDTSPWDYWERDFTTPKPHIKTALDVIETVLAANPDHYGAIHLKIHLYEASTTPERAEKGADKLAGLAPGSGHLVHMPGHTYFRIGRYLDSLDTNVKAVAVDENYLAQVTGSTLYRYGYYPHNVHFVLVSAQMAGDAKVSMDYAKKLDALLPLAVLDEAEWIAPIKAAPYFAYAQFGDLIDVLALKDPGSKHPYIQAMWHYARGAKLAEAGKVLEARAEKAAIDDLMGADKIKSAGIPAGDILALAGHIIEARALMAEKRPEAAVALLEEAVAIQNGMPYTEPPFWYYAIEQTLGAALFAAGRYEDAEAAFKSSLIRHPNSAWSLYGLKMTQLKLNRPEEAQATARLLKKASRVPQDVPVLRL